MVECVGLADASSHAPDDDRKLRLVVDLRRERGIPADHATVPHDRARPLAEHERCAGRIRALFVHVLAVIAADRDDLAGPRNGRLQLDLIERSPLGKPAGIGCGLKRRKHR